MQPNGALLQPAWPVVLFCISAVSHEALLQPAWPTVLSCIPTASPCALSATPRGSRTHHPGCAFEHRPGAERHQGVTETRTAPARQAGPPSRTAAEPAGAPRNPPGTRAPRQPRRGPQAARPLAAAHPAGHQQQQQAVVPGSLGIRVIGASMRQFSPGKSGKSTRRRRITCGGRMSRVSEK